MQRREALRLLAASAALPLFSRDALGLFQEVQDQLPETAALRILNPRQNATVIAITETIIPQTDTPGAKGARVNEFIDVVLADWFDESEKSAFLASLADFDSRCRQTFGMNFADCSPQQQSEFLKIAEDETEFRRRGRRIWDLEHVEAKEFYPAIKQLTLIGYYTSEVGFEQELHGEIIPSRHAGCAPLDEEAAK